MSINEYRMRFFLIALAGLSLLAGLWSGLVRLGWTIPSLNEGLTLAHGPLMVVGFLGTLIGLERAVALERFWPYGIPILTALSTVSVLGNCSTALSASFAILASLLMLAVFIVLYHRYPAAHFIVMALSALAWLAGNILWLTSFPLFRMVPWWVAFLVLMIAGERLELSRIRQPPKRVLVLFHAGLAIAILGIIYSLFKFDLGLRVAGAGFLAIAMWLIRYDLVWQSVRQSGLPRFMAACLILGYFWLAAGGILWISFSGFFTAGPYYDAMLHSIFLGFVFSMIFAHALIIFPTITGLALPFANAFYLHAGLLHVSLVLRIAGDLALSPSLKQWGGLLNVLSILLFLLNNVLAAMNVTQAKEI